MLHHRRNLGKGAAIRTGLAAASGRIVLIQDADLEYDPADYPTLLAPFKEEGVEAVYGYRRHMISLAEYLGRLKDAEGGLGPRLLAHWSYFAGAQALGWIMRLRYGACPRDPFTGYKVFRTETLRSLALARDGFDFCGEATCRLLARRVPIVDVPIHYAPRSFLEGKKLRARDGFRMLRTILREARRRRPAGRETADGRR